MSRFDIYSVRYPLLPLKNVVIFPRNIVTLLVGRTRSIQAVEEAMARDRRIVVTAHRDPEIDDPRPEDLYAVGTLAEIVSVERQQGSNIQVVLEGISRVDILQFDNSRPFFTVRTEPAHEDDRPRRGGPGARSRSCASWPTSTASTKQAQRRSAGDDPPSDRRRATWPTCWRRSSSPTLAAAPGAASNSSTRSTRLERRGGAPDRRTRRCRPGAADQGPGARADRQEPARVLPARAAQGDPRRALAARAATRSRRCASKIRERRPAPKPSKSGC